MKKIFIVIALPCFALAAYADWVVYDNTNGIPAKYLEAHKSVKLSAEKYFLYMPNKISKNDKIGLWSYIHSLDDFEMPEDWKQFCDKNKIAVLAPQRVGNGHDTDRRIGVTLLGTIKTMVEKKIDPKNVYVFGYSGGGRMAAMALFYYSQVFHGCLGVCGIQFPRKIEFKSCEKKDEYGDFEYRGSDIEKIKKNNPFAIITGSKDFRYCYLKDIFEYGFKKDGYKARLFDYKDYDHELCQASQLEEVLAFFKEKK